MCVQVWQGTVEAQGTLGLNLGFWKGSFGEKGLSRRVLHDMVMQAGRQAGTRAGDVMRNWRSW